MLSMCLDALSESWQVAVHCCLELIRVNHGNDVVQSGLDFISITESDTLKARFDSVEKPVICWAQIRTVSRVRQKFDVNRLEPLNNRICSVRWCAIMQEYPRLLSGPVLRSAPPDLFSESLQDSQVDFTTYAKASGGAFFVDDTLGIKKDHQHHLCFCPLHTGF